MVGAEQGRLALALARHSGLKIYGVESDPAKVAAARAALDQGADVVFAADPDSSDSALVEVAGQPGAFCIGIGTDQWKAVPESQPCLVTSIVKSIGRRTIITNPVFESYHTRIVTTVTGEQGGETLDPGNWALDVELAPFHDHEDAVTNEVREMLTALDDSTRALHGDTAATTTAAPAPEEADHLAVSYTHLTLPTILLV